MSLARLLPLIFCSRSLRARSTQRALKRSRKKAFRGGSSVGAGSLDVWAKMDVAPVLCLLDEERIRSVVGDECMLDLYCARRRSCIVEIGDAGGDESPEDARGEESDGV